MKIYTEVNLERSDLLDAYLFEKFEDINAIMFNGLIPDLLNKANKIIFTDLDGRKVIFKQRS